MSETAAASDLSSGAGGSAGFYSAIEPFSRFGSALDADTFHALPDDWVLGLGDIAKSTQAIAEGRYKTVNFAGAALIAAVSNALPGVDFPFVFGGDGASLALPPAAVARAREAMAATAAWARSELDFELRVAMIPIAAVRAAGQDVRVARYGASRSVSYAMFAGGGMNWAEAEMKAGAFAIEPAPAGARPNLEGLSCRWSQLPARNGVILSLIVAPGPMSTADDFRATAQHVLETAARAERAGNPVGEDRLHYRWAPVSFDEARIPARGGLVPRTLRFLAHYLFAAFFVNFRVAAGSFSPERYLRETVENADFRKFDDALRMTIDCTPALADEIELLLADATDRFGILSGVHRQEAAQITCIVPSVARSDHMHFVDGAGGGYAEASRRLKERRPE